MHSKFRSPKLPLMVSKLLRRNDILSAFAMASFLITLLSLVTSLIQVTKGPTVIAVSPDACMMAAVKPPKPEDEVSQMAKRYVELRYNWNAASVRQKLQSTEAFIPVSVVKAFRSSTENVAKFSIAKNVSQRAYLNFPIEMKDGGKRILISGDRVSEIQGLAAAGKLRVELSLESGPRTNENPWGLYVTKEKEL